MTAKRPERTASVTELQRHGPTLVDCAEAGQCTVITRHGRPVARLVPYGVPVDELGGFEALMDDIELLHGRARDFVRRHHTTTTPTEEP